MLKEFVDTIVGLANQAAQPKILKPQGEPSHIYILADHTGAHHMEADPPPRAHQARSLQAVVEFAKREGTAAVWFSRDKVVCLLDDRERRNQVTLPLAFSVPLLALSGIENKKLSQREIVFLLRTTFARCLDQAGDLLAVLRGVRFRTAGQGEAVIGHGKASVGRQLQQEITGTGALPECVTLTVPIFASAFPALRSQVQLALEPDPATETFQLVPLPGEIEAAIASAEDRIGELLREALGPEALIYYGQP